MGKTGQQIKRALGYFGVFIGGQIAGGMVTGFIAAFKAALELGAEAKKDMDLYRETYMNTVMDMSGLMIAIAAIITIAFLAIFYKVRKENMLEQINCGKVGAKAIGVSALVGFLLHFVVVAFLYSLPESIIEGYADASSALGDTRFSFALLGTVIGAPIVEEIFFRGLIFDRLKKGMPVVAAMLLSSLAFGAPHLQPVWILYAAFLGMVFSYIFQKTGSIRATIATHLAFNLTSTLIGFIGISIPVMGYYVSAGIAAALLVIIFILVKKNEVKMDKTDIEITTVAA